MSDPSTRKSRPDPANDGDATDAEINRKLTEHLRANAIALRDDAAHGQTNARHATSGQASPLSMRTFGMMLSQAFGLVAVVFLMLIAWIYVSLCEKEAA